MRVVTGFGSWIGLKVENGLVQLPRFNDLLAIRRDGAADIAPEWPDCVLCLPRIEIDVDFAVSRGQDCGVVRSIRMLKRGDGKFKSALLRSQVAACLLGRIVAPGRIFPRP